jgi:hypothetical protein
VSFCLVPPESDPATGAASASHPRCSASRRPSATAVRRESPRGRPRAKHPCQHPEQRRLADPVRPDEQQRLALTHLEPDAGERCPAPEALDHVTREHAYRARSRPRRSAGAPERRRDLIRIDGRRAERLERCRGHLDEMRLGLDDDRGGLGHRDAARRQLVRQRVQPRAPRQRPAVSPITESTCPANARQDAASRSSASFPAAVRT